LVATHLVGASQRDERRAKIAHRVQRTLEFLPSLPDSAFIEIRVVSVLLGRSTASIWRDVAHGRLARPVRVGARSTRWRVGDVRAAMK
jgi:predicted DNA-binding transcriptional regulator AlpA